MTSFPLAYGSHPRRDDGMCLMEAVAYLGGEPHTDHPRCACPVLAAYGRQMNDAMGTGAAGDAYRGRYLAGLAPRLVGTRSTPEVERRRAFVLVDHAVRVIAPLALDAVGRVDEAAQLRALAPVVDPQSARAAAVEAARAAADSAAAARAAAYDVARAADTAAAAAAVEAARAAAAAAYAAAAAAARAAARAAADSAAAAAAAAARAADTAAAAARVADPDTVWTAARAAFVAALEVIDA